MPSSNTRICPACAMVMPASFPAGLCPKCLLVVASTPAGAPPEDLEAAERTIPVAPPVSGSTPVRPTGVPSLELLRKLFPELEILDVLGAGGMGAVYKARQPRLNRLIALKIMVAAPGHEADFALRFEREAQVLARLSHPHIVILYDFGELSPERTRADPLFYFLMEFVDGTDLGQLIKSKELKPSLALTIVPQICEALQYAHDQGITHRDIKPANILIDKKGTVKIADFGLAKMVGGDAADALMTGLTQTGTAMGTPHYMAPEQWEHPELVDHRADIYALGVVFYEMLTGERPAGVFEPPSRKTSPPVDKKLDGVVMRAMDKNPDRRYQQAGQIGDDVTRISGANKRKPATTGAAAPKRSPLKPLLALGVVAVLAVGGWMLWQGGAGSPPVAVPPKTAQIAAAEFPPGQWVKVLNEPGKLPGALAAHEQEVWNEGWLTAKTNSPLPGVNIPRFEGKNQGIRLRVRQQTGNASSSICQLWVRKGTAQNSSTNDTYRLSLQTSGAVLNFWEEKNRRPQNLHAPQPQPLAPGEEVTLELFVIGQRLIARCGGRLLPIVEDARLTAGALGLQILHEARAIEVINLDGLSEEAALKLAGLSEAQLAAAASSNQKAMAAFPVGQWTQVLTSQAEVDAIAGLKGKVTLKPDGWLDFSVPKDASGAALAAFSAANAGVRVKLRIADKAPQPVVATLTLRHTTTPPPRQEGYRLQILGGETANPKVSLAHYDGLTRKTNIFNQKLLPGTLMAGDEMILEFYAIGTRLIGRINGELLPIAEDQRLTRGIFTLQTGHLVRDLELIHLDGLSEAEALDLVGVNTIAPQPRLTGRLRGTGFHLDGKPLDLKNAEGITDFVQVVLTDIDWFGLRANGDLVIPGENWSSKNIARLLSNHHLNRAGTIDRNGRLKITRDATEGVKAVPEEVQRIGVVDASWENGQAIALLKDGSIRVWGEHYKTGYNGDSVWPDPPAGALQNVSKIATAHLRAATLQNGGKLHLWGGLGNTRGPFDLGELEEWGEIADLESGHDYLRVLARDGTAYKLGGRRPLTKELLLKDVEAIKSRLMLAKGATQWTWKDSSPSQYQTEVDALLKQIGRLHRDAFDLRVSGTETAPNIAAVWIEPVISGWAAGPPAAAVPPRTALGGPSALPSAKPGRLRSSGTTVNGKPHDLAKFAAFDDFVDVAGGWGRWVALRANGQTISSDGKADFKDIARIAASFNAEYAFITKAGKLVIPDYEKWTLPSSLEQGVVDAALGIQHGIALREGGKAVVFGARYDGTVGDPSDPKQYGTPRWPAPEVRALEKVKAVAATVTHAATLHENGSLSLWGWEGPLKWQADPRQKPLRQLRSTEDGFWALDEAGQLWHLPVPRNPAPGQPVYVTDKPSPSESGVTHLGPRCWRRKSGEWIASMNTNEGMDLMKAAGISESTAFYLDGGTFDGKPFASLLWIEPVASGSAAGPPAAAVPPQTALGGPSALPPFTDREAAEWVLGLEYDACNVKVQMLKGGKFIEVRKLADLPAEPFVIHDLRVNLSPKEQAELWAKVTDAVVLRLAGLRSLKLAAIRGNVTGASLKVMAHHPGLERLDFEGLNLRADDLRHLRASPLQTLEIPLLQVTDPESLAVLTTMPNLLTLQFDGSLDPALAAALPNLPELEILRANNSANTTDEVLPLLAERLPQLSVLQHWGAKNLKGSTLGSLMALKSLTTLGLTDTSVNDEGLAQIAGMPQLLTLDLGQTRITDACLPTLKSLPKLESLQIYQTELTDAALLELASIPTLKRLGTKASGYSDWKPGVTFTEAGIAAFEKLRPDVEVVK